MNLNKLIENKYPKKVFFWQIEKQVIIINIFNYEVFTHMSQIFDFPKGNI